MIQGLGSKGFEVFKDRVLKLELPWAGHLFGNDGLYSKHCQTPSEVPQHTEPVSDIIHICYPDSRF